MFGEDVADAREAILSDVGASVFGITHGLQREFGQARCYNTPLAEANIVGRAVGQAIRGLRPIAEIQFFDYIWPAMQQIKSEMATIRWRSNGTFTCPAVIRCRSAATWERSGTASAASPCSPTCRPTTVVFPSRSGDAAGLLRTAVLAEDPVLFCEHKHLLRQRYTADPFLPPEYRIPFGKADIRRPGDDLTLVTWGATVQKSLEAADGGR